MLEGEELTCEQIGEGEYFFYYPDEGERERREQEKAEKQEKAENIIEK